MVTRWQLAVLLVLATVVTGCGGGGDDTESAAISPPAPTPAEYTVDTTNYFEQYGSIDVADPPFNAYWQFANEHYPIPVSYARAVTDPAGFDLVTDTEEAIRAWAEADPRVSIVSGAQAGSARIHIVLQGTISYAGQTNIIGLTTVEDSHRPSFKVEVATQYLRSGGDPGNPNDYIQMPAEEIMKTLAHEIGHAFGIGHSPDSRDLMFYMANGNQGDDFSDFITFGDAMTIWSTLNSRHINWVQSRPPVTPAGTGQPLLGLTRATAPRGPAVCVYKRF